MFTVRINQLKVRTKIGVSVQERKKKQLLLVSIKFSYKVSNKKDVDNINNLANYTDIKKFLKTYIESSRCRTLEKLIMECSQNLRKRFKTQNVSIKIEKPEVAKKLSKKHVRRNMPVHYKDKTGAARKKAYAEHKAIKKKQKKGLLGSRGFY